MIPQECSNEVDCESSKWQIALQLTLDGHSIVKSSFDNYNHPTLCEYTMYTYCLTMEGIREEMEVGPSKKFQGLNL